MSQTLAHGVTDGRATPQPGAVLGPEDGEHLVHFRDHGNVYIKIGSATGSSNVALGTQ